MSTAMRAAMRVTLPAAIRARMRAALRGLHASGTPGPGLRHSRDPAARTWGARTAAAPPPGWRLGLTLVLMLWALAVAAQTQVHTLPHARVDRDRVGIDESFTLVVEVEGGPRADRLDLSPLLDSGDFTLLRQDNTQEMRLVGGRNQLYIQYSFELAAQRTGRLTIPPLRIGDKWTRALAVSVAPPGTREPPPLPPVDGEAFIESRIADRTPYVQQSVGFTLRLYYDGDSLIDGALTQDPPQNADLFKIGEDLHYHRQLGERVFKVLERRYSLVPARAGAVVVPSARFEGRSARSMFDDLLGGGQGNLRVAGPRHVLQAQPIPAQAPQPWLPLRAVRVQWLESPREIRGGEAATVTVRMVADGAGIGQMPEPALEVAAGDAQVFADAPRSEERFVDGRLQTMLTRSFSVVPATPGQTLVLRAPALSWWDTSTRTPRTTRLPELRLSVLAGGQTATQGAGAAASAADTPAPWRRSLTRTRDKVLGWYREDPALRIAWTLLICSWVAVMGLLLWTRLRARRRRGTAPASQPAGKPATPNSASGASSLPAAQTLDAVALRRLFTAGDLGEIAHTLCALATPPTPDLDRLRARLADPAQRDAVVLLQRARWGRGDPAEARRALRDAFAEGPRWRTPAPVRRETPLLPPLYPA